MKRIKLLSLLLALAMLAGLMSGCTAKDMESALDTATQVVQALTEEEAAPETALPAQDAETISEDGSYTAKDDVALYINTYGHLPGNFVTKREAQDAGWNGGSVEKYLPGMCIGGDRFGNREGLLPEAEGRVWTECDINTLGADSRGAERLVFSNDGLIFYSDDHYESFQQLYD